MLTTFLRCLIVLVLLIIPTTFAFAGFINVSGSFEYGPGLKPGASVELVGDRGFTFNGRVLDAQTIVEPASQCFGLPGECTAGSTISLHATAVGLDVPGTATLDGISYSDVGGLNSPTSLQFDFTGQVLGPPFGPSGFAVVTVPVDFSGIFFNRPAQEQLVASAHATLTLQQTDCCGGPAWLYQDVRYDLTPVPEPSTLLLLGTGVACVALRRLRRLT
jgi:PEP-CTERM motif